MHQSPEHAGGIAQRLSVLSLSRIHKSGNSNGQLSRAGKKFAGTGKGKCRADGIGADALTHVMNIPFRVRVNVNQRPSRLQSLTLSLLFTGRTNPPGPRDTTQRERDLPRSPISYQIKSFNLSSQR